jgi:biopolymer transport protein ExbB/TolQ
MFTLLLVVILFLLLFVILLVPTLLLSLIFRILSLFGIGRKHKVYYYKRTWHTDSEEQPYEESQEQRRQNTIDKVKSYNNDIKKEEAEYVDFEEIKE